MAVKVWWKCPKCKELNPPLIQTCTNAKCRAQKPEDPTPVAEPVKPTPVKPVPATAKEPANPTPAVPKKEEPVSTPPKFKFPKILIPLLSFGAGFLTAFLDKLLDAYLGPNDYSKFIRPILDWIISWVTNGG